MGEYEFRTKPFDHQTRIFNETRDVKAHALLWEQGCAKTKPTIDIACYNFLRCTIDAMLIVAPPGVERNWLSDEIPVHMPEPVLKRAHLFFWRTKKAQTKWHEAAFQKCLIHDGLAVFAISYEAFMTKRGKAAIWAFLRRRRVFYIVDEGHNIKTPKAKRTRSIVNSARYAEYRRLLTGTPGDKPFDLYSQLKFVRPDIWNQVHAHNFHAFKHHFGEWLDREEFKIENGYDLGYDKLLDYKNLEQLNSILRSVSDRVLKEDVLDLPPKLYTKVYFEMTPRQRAMYEELREEYILELQNGAVVDGALAIVRLLRLQQIACGYAVSAADEPIELCDKTNPRLDASLGFLENINHQVIIWSRFRFDRDLLSDALGKRAVRYDGTMDEDEAERSKLAFNAGDAQYILGSAQKGGSGLTLLGNKRAGNAKTTYYYSNTFKLIERLQSEDRNHRPGAEGSEHGEHGFGVLYGDACCEDTVDMQIIRSLRDKFDIASKITGDTLREWI